MQEITLSDNLQQIELEIRFHKSKIGESIWEIGRRLKHVKEEDLAHGQFLDWVESVGIAKNEAQKYIKVVSELNPNYETFNNLGLSALYLIATLPEEEKQVQLEKVEQGDNPTVRELQEVKRQLKLAEADKERLRQQNENLAEQALKQEVVEKEVVIEKVPEDYETIKKLNSDLLVKNQKLNNKSEEFERQIRIKEHELSQLKEDTAEAIALKEVIENLNSEKAKTEITMKNVFEISSMLTEFEEFFDSKMAPMRFKALISGLGTEIQIEKLRDMLVLVGNWLDEMSTIVPENGRRIIEGEIING